MESLNTFTITNPAIRGMAPDPSWIWDGDLDCAVLVNSSFNTVPGLPIHTSRELDCWQNVGFAIDENMAARLFLPFVQDSGGAYAPTIRKIRGQYVIACTIARLQDDEARAAGVDEAELERCLRANGNFVLTASSLEGPWNGPFWIEGAEGIDPDIFEDANGDVFWTQTRPAHNPQWEQQTEVWTCRIDPQTWRFVDMLDDLSQSEPCKTVLWRGSMIGAVWCEGPHLYRMGEWVYLMTAEGGTSRDHSEMIMRAHVGGGLHAAIDRWHDEYGACRTQDGDAVLCETVRMFATNPKNPFITHRNLSNMAPVQCVGHADLMHHPRYGWWLACLGVRESVLETGASWNYVGRETFLAPVAWQVDPSCNVPPREPLMPSHEDTLGWPVLRGSLGRLPDTLTIERASGELVEASVDADESELQLLDWDAQHIDDSRTLALPTVPNMRYVRMDHLNMAMAVPQGKSVSLYEDSGHYVECLWDPSESLVRWKLVADHWVDDRSYTWGDESSPYEEPMIPVVMLAYSTLYLGALPSRVWNECVAAEHGCTVACVARELDVFGQANAQFLSTEWSQSFTGCLLGVEQ